MAMRISTDVTSKGSSSLCEEHGAEVGGAGDVICCRRCGAEPLDSQDDGCDDGQDGHDGRKADGARRAAAAGCVLRGRHSAA